MNQRRFFQVVFAAVLVCGMHGCATLHGRAPGGSGAQIVRVACMYGKTPWLNLDKAGDMDPEGIEYRVFLDPGTNRGIEADGLFNIELYQLTRDPQSDKVVRTMVSDWHYPTSQFTRIKSTILGTGYLIKLRWAKKELAGEEVELITRFKGPGSPEVSAGTKRLNIPKYSS